MEQMVRFGINRLSPCDSDACRSSIQTYIPLLRSFGRTIQAGFQLWVALTQRNEDLQSKSKVLLAAADFRTHLFCAKLPLLLPGTYL